MNFTNLKRFYNKIALFNKNNTELYSLNNTIFVNFINKDHYQLLQPNLEFIKKRILNITTNNYNLILF